MRLRHQSGSGGRSLRVFLERREPAGRAPATRLSHRFGSLHVLRDDSQRPERLELAEAASESPPAAGLLEIDARAMPGLYELTLPARVFAPGSRSVVAALRFPGVSLVVIEPAVIEVELVAFDPYDGVGIGLDGFTKSVRHQNLTSILVDIMPDSVRALARQRRSQ
jgi:hypothetical protein